MSNVKLKPGEDNISSCEIRPEKGRGLRLQWSIVLYNGQKLTKNTRAKMGTPKGEIRARARAKAAELLRTSGQSGTWKSTSLFVDYIKQDCLPAIENNISNPNTRSRYKTYCSHLCEVFEGFTIADACRPKNLMTALNQIAKEHGTETARGVKKMSNKWVMQRLVLEEVLDYNPLNNANIQITVQHKASNKGEGGVALTEEEYDKAVEYMLSCKADDPKYTTVKRGRYTAKDRAAKRQNIIEISLLQAATGLRISEARFLTWDLVDITDDGVFVTVLPDVSKTHKGRTVQILDSRVAELIIDRKKRARKRDKYVFGSPIKPEVIWDKDNCVKAVNDFLQNEVAVECGIANLTNHGSHIWRATLNTIAALRNVPEIVRAAAFGHSVDVNRLFYTDVTDITPFTKTMMKG